MQQNVFDRLEQFEAWKQALDLARCIHQCTKAFPRDEQYGLVSQLRRAGVSVAANIAEGFGRYTYADKKHKYVQARGELYEVFTLCKHAQVANYMEDTVFEDLRVRCEELLRILNALIKSVSGPEPV